MAELQNSPEISVQLTTGAEIRVEIGGNAELDFDVIGTGPAGADGADGHSPVVTASKTDKTTTVYVDGEAIAAIDDGADGADGSDGADGHSPVVTASKAGSTTTVYVDGTAIATIEDGDDGQDGSDGHSPVVTASKTGKVTTVYVDGTAIATINDGQEGAGSVADVTVNGTSVLDGTTAKVIVPTNVSDLNNDSGYITGLVILSYGSSTWNDFITAYNAKKVVYCRASSNSNPASGSQTRLAFMAYVSDAANPTNVEFQYYRSVSSHSASQQGDQVYVYKLTNTNSWTVTVREAYTKIAAGTGLSGSYSSGTYTLSATIPAASSDTPQDLGTAAAGSSAKFSRADHVHKMPSAADVGAVAASALIDLIYPVGSIYLSVNSADPNLLWPGTTWVRIEDKFLLAAGGNYAAGSTGGEATHTLTANEMPSHTHTQNQWIIGAANGFGHHSSNAGVPYTTGSTPYFNINDLRSNGWADASNYNPEYTGGGAAHENMPPYLVVYMWTRTA